MQHYAEKGSQQGTELGMGLVEARTDEQILLAFQE
jgi:hypothetical protein